MKNSLKRVFAVTCYLAAPVFALTPFAQPAFAETVPQQTDVAVADARAVFMAGDHAGGLALLLPLAEAGHPRAINLVAAAHQYGMGVAADAEQAIAWFTRAAAQGYPPAQYNLGYLHAYGMDGLTPDLALARTYFAQAAAQDYGPALSAFGVMLFEGTGGAQDPVNGLRMITRAAELGDPFGHQWMGYLQREGEGVPRDPMRARDHYTIAALMGDAVAQVEAGLMAETGEGGPVNLVLALDLYMRAVAQGDPYGGMGVARIMQDNPGVFGDAVLGLAYCLWAIDAAAPEDAQVVRATCDPMAETFSEKDRAQALSRADGL